MGSEGWKFFGSPFIALLLAICTHQRTYANPIDWGSSEDENTSRLCKDNKIYFNETRECSHAFDGYKGPCGELMLVKITDKHVGIGKCVCEQPWCGGRPTTYWPQKNRCYYIFDQGPCAKGQWIVPSRKGVGKCENIPCLEKYNQQAKLIRAEFLEKYDGTFLYRYVFPYKNNCYITNAEGDGLCPEGEMASFSTPTPIHTCTKPVLCPQSPPPFSSSLAFGSSSSCPPGEEPDSHGDCQPQTEFD